MKIRFWTLPNHLEGETMMINKTIIDTCDEICNNFCKFSNTGEKCVWCQTHDNECPLDKLIKITEDEDDGK